MHSSNDGHKDLKWIDKIEWNKQGMYWELYTRDVPTVSHRTMSFESIEAGKEWLGKQFNIIERR